MKASRAIFLVHSWAGLGFFIVLTLVLATGTLSVLRDEIDWLVYPQLRVTPAPQQAGFDGILAAVANAYPDVGLVGQVPAQGAGPRTAAGVVAVSPTEGVRRIWIDPYRGVVQGTTPLLTPGYFLSQLHAYLFIPTFGYPIVCSLAFFLLASLVTGLFVYKKFWRGFFRRPRFRTWRIAMGDLHRLCSLWSIWFLVIIILTSLWYFWIRVGEPLLGFPHAIEERALPQVADGDLARMGPTPPGTLSLDTLAERVRARFPGFTIRHASLPAMHGGPVSFNGNEGAVFGVNLAAIHVDPYRGEILGTDLHRENMSFAVLGVVANALHFGDFAGLASKLFWFVFGLATTALSLTGIAIFWHRSNRAVRHVARGWFASLGRTLVPWSGAMGLLKPVNLVVIGFACWATIAAYRFYDSGAATVPARYASQPVGPWRLGAIAIAGLGDARDPIRPGARVMVLVQFCPGCWNDIKKVWVDVGKGSRGSDGRRVVGQPGFAVANVQLPDRLDEEARLWLVAEAWDGARYEANWPLTTQLQSR